MPSLPVVSTRSSRAAIDRLLDDASPEVRNRVGEPVAVAASWADDVAEDPQRLGLLPAALVALRDGQEAWSFRETAGETTVEHQPHLLWCRLDDASTLELVVAGTRRVEGTLSLHTWFRMAEPAEALGRYLRRGARVFPPLTLRASYDELRDVLYLRPDPPVSYRVARLSADTPVYGYLSDGQGFPSLAGLEIQDTRHHGPGLADDPSLTHLLSTPCELAGRSGPLGSHVAHLLERESGR